MFKPGQTIEIEVDRWTPKRSKDIYFVNKSTVWIQCIYLKSIGSTHQIQHHTHEMIIDSTTDIREFVL